MLTEKEKAVLKLLGKSPLVTLPEVKKILGETTQDILQKLMAKKLVSEVRPAGIACYVITIHGTKALQEIQEQ